MNCAQFESVLPEYLEGARSLEQQAHHDSCSACSNLVADLKLIASEASLLRALEEPSPRVWNQIEIRLREEGLIRDQPRARRFLPFSRWRLAWLAPVAAALVIIAAIKLYQPVRIGDSLPVQKPAVSPAAPALAAAPASAEDREMLRAVSSRLPAQLAAYKADLEAANAFIRDAERSVHDNPNDLYSQQMLINAYEQKQMLFRLAVDQSEGEQ
jgi:hypothetical protein